MQTLKQHINENRGLRFIYEKLEICSAAGRKRLLSQQFITRDFELQMELDTLDFFTNFVSDRENAKSIVAMQHRMYCLNDIHQTIHNLRSAQTLDDIELFEIKNFCMISRDICKILSTCNIDILPFHDLNPIVEILDPEHNGIQSFYIYSAYDEKLAALRKEYDIAKNANENEKAERIAMPSRPTTTSSPTWIYFWQRLCSPATSNCANRQFLPPTQTLRERSILLSPNR